VSDFQKANKRISVSNGESICILRELQELSQNEPAGLDTCFEHTKIGYAFFPQHFLYFRPLPQIQGSLRPTFGVALTIGLLGGQQLVLLQLDSLPSSNSSDNVVLFSFILTSTLFQKFYCWF
jgi:hypothetical protein